MVYIRAHGLSYTFWCLNPNSGDTGGLLANNWTTVNAAKMALLRTDLAPLIGTPLRRPSSPATDVVSAHGWPVTVRVTMQPWPANGASRGKDGPALVLPVAVFYPLSVTISVHF
jgi:endoglucanase